MAYLKRWESPRKQGRNDKGRGGAARQRQLRKRTQTLRQRLQAPPGSPSNNHPSKEREAYPLSFFMPAESGTEAK